VIVDHDITAVCITDGFSCAATETLIIATTNYVITDADVDQVLPITGGGELFPVCQSGGLIRKILLPDTQSEPAP
jgi:hypothetical protein